MSVYLHNVAIISAGMENWQAAKPILQGIKNYQSTPVAITSSPLLPPRERRRTSPTINLALMAARQAMENSRYEAAQVASVFSSAGGDFDIFDYCCRELSEETPVLSPTKFHNSLLNSPAGYWHIATRSRQPSSSLSTNHHSFAGALLAAYLYALDEKSPVLLVNYDVPAAPILQAQITLQHPFAVALLLDATPSAALAKFQLNLRESQASATVMSQEALERLRLDSPASKSLPLLQAIAEQRDDEVVFDYSPYQQLTINVAPCNN